MQDIYNFLNQHKVPYKKHDHIAVFTNEESEKLNIGKPEENTKNLFLADEKNLRFYLLTIQHGKRADLKKFSSVVGERRLHFANADFLKKFLNLTPGSVTPLGLLFDDQNKVKFFCDEDLLKQKKIFVHPDINTATLEFFVNDFKKIFPLFNHPINLVII